jgi:hypothetical protein
MMKRYAIKSEFVFDDCLVTPSVYTIAQALSLFRVDGIAWCEVFPILTRKHIKYPE